MIIESNIQWWYDDDDDDYMMMTSSDNWVWHTMSTMFTVERDADRYLDRGRLPKHLLHWQTISLGWWHGDGDGDDDDDDQWWWYDYSDDMVAHNMHNNDKNDMT